MAQATRKYSCTRRSSLPLITESEGYSTRGNVLRGDLLLDGANVIAPVEDLDVEVFRGAGREQAQPVHRLPQVADDRHVGGHAHNDLGVDPGLLRYFLSASRCVSMRP